MATAVVALIIGVMASAVPAASDSPGVVPPGQEGKIPAGDWTQDQIDTLLDLIDEAETVLPVTYPMAATYEDLAATLGAMGYHDFGVEAPGGYAHWINNDLLDGDTLDPALAESLVYQYDYTDSTYRLVSAMYMLGSDYDAMSVPAEIAWLPGWHAHSDLCATPDLVYSGFAPCSGSSIALSSYPMMHVWIVDNPCNHRFGGVDQGGLHCDMTHHDPGEHEPGEHEPGEHEPGEHETAEVDTSNGAVPTAGPAPAVVATANFTG
ncbi:MAG: hypothetical protein ABI239_00905 [Aquihabitans sp.]